MNDQHGFFTLIGICFLLMATICVLNIKESGKVFALDATNFIVEQELQNIADSALIEAAEKYLANNEIIPVFLNHDVPSNNQYQISVSQPVDSEQLKNISVEVYGERGEIYQGKRTYTSQGYSDSLFKDNGVERHSSGVVLISVATCEGKVFGGKIYRRSFAYILDDEKIIRYLNTD